MRVRGLISELLAFGDGIILDRKGIAVSVDFSSPERQAGEWSRDQVSATLHGTLRSRRLFRTHATDSERNLWVRDSWYSVNRDIGPQFRSAFSGAAVALRVQPIIVPSRGRYGE